MAKDMPITHSPSHRESVGGQVFQFDVNIMTLLSYTSHGWKNPSLALQASSLVYLQAPALSHPHSLCRQDNAAGALWIVPVINMLWDSGDGALVRLITSWDQYKSRWIINGWIFIHSECFTLLTVKFKSLCKIISLAWVKVWVTKSVLQNSFESATLNSRGRKYWNTEFSWLLFQYSSYQASATLPQVHWVAQCRIKGNRTYYFFSIFQRHIVSSTKGENSAIYKSAKPWGKSTGGWHWS